MQTTIEVFGKEEVLEGINDWFGVDSFENVMSKVENGTTSANFGNSKQVPIVKSDKFGRIGLREFFENNDYGNGEILDLTELKEILGEQQWEFKSHDNTYNYNGFLEREMDFQTIEGLDDETTIVFYAIHVGLDVRAGYTKSFAVKYDNHYDGLECLISQFCIGSAEFTSNGEKLEARFYGEVASEYLNVYICDNDNNQIGQSYEEQTVDIDMYDKEDCLNSFMEYLKANKISFDTDSIIISE